MYRGADFFDADEDGVVREMIPINSNTRRVVRAPEVVNLIAKNDAAQTTHLFMWLRILVLVD